MTIDPLALLLIQFFCLLTGTATLAWALMAYPLGIASKACWTFSAANLLVLVGLFLTTFRDDTPSYLFWFVADMAILLAFSLLRQGTRKLFKLPGCLHQDLSLLGITALFMLSYPPQMDSNTPLAIIFSIAAAIYFLLLTRDNLIALFPNIGQRYAVALTIPILGLVLLFCTRATLLLIAPESAEQLAAIKTAEAVPMLWVFVVIALILNVTMMGNALTRLVQKIRLQADKDYLTQLWNRRALNKQLDRVHQRWLRDSVPYSLILFDLDLFKKINDTHTHAAGDAVLVHTASVLSKIIRRIDTLSRYGGEEFLLLLPASCEEAAQITAEKLRRAIKNRPLQWQSQYITVSASFGCVTVAPGDTPEQVLNRADKAMYHAKEQGRDGICQFSPEMADEARMKPKPD
jgi:diguanylate cyclase (GGDEF)-like protein